jgi:MoaA/NifB/PqqE/SkfB family radical SAM enzyme
VVLIIVKNMNFLQISLTNKCNMDCSYCPIAKWRNNPEFPNTLSNDLLIPFLRDRISPSDWHIELTGGEPALYNGLDELLIWLQQRGYKGLVKTNGTLPVFSVPNFKRIAAFHDLDNPPVWFDEILIISRHKYIAPHMRKARVCIKNKWKYKLIKYSDGGLLYGGRHDYKKMLFITPDGKLRPCNADHETENYLPSWIEPKKICGHCKAACDFEIFMRD